MKSSLALSGNLPSTILHIFQAHLSASLYLSIASAILITYHFCNHIIHYPHMGNTSQISKVSPSSDPPDCDSCAEDFKCRFTCETAECHRRFPTIEAANDHMDSKKHRKEAVWFELVYCRWIFPTRREAEQHMHSEKHWSRDYTCDRPDCNRTFYTRVAQEKHMDAKNHWYGCYKC